jgi:hypothetical protein
VSDARYWPIQVLAAGLLIVAATVMPWATYKDVTTGVTTTFRGGDLSALLAVVGVASVALSLLSITRTSTLVKRVHVAVGSTALVVSIVLALSKISAANHVTQRGPSQTSYALGSAVAVVAAAVIALTCVVKLGAPTRIDRS